MVPASSGVDTQSIIQRARHYDKDGIRIVGTITKPGLINDRVACLVARRYPDWIILQTKRRDPVTMSFLLEYRLPVPHLYLVPYECLRGSGLVIESIRSLPVNLLAQIA